MCLVSCPSRFCRVIIHPDLLGVASAAPPVRSAPPTSWPAPHPKGATQAGDPFLGATASLLLAALALAAVSLRLWRPGAHRQANSATGRLHLPKPSGAAALFSRTHHEKLQDAKYLQSILEAELASQEPEPLPLNENEANPPLDSGNSSRAEGICARSEK